MADEPGESKNSDMKKFAVFIGSVAAIVTILVGINALTGVNLVSDLLHPKSTPTPTPIPTPTPTPIPIPTLPPRPPDFITQSRQWTGQCQIGCPMSAIFLNIGGFGAATATFHVMSNRGNNADLADCSVQIPSADNEGTASAGCTAYSSELTQYFRSNPGETVSMSITINNPLWGTGR